MGVHIFLTSALAGSEGSASHPGRFTPGTHWIGGWVDPRAGMDDVEKREFSTLPGLELQPLGRSARSQSLYRLRFSHYSDGLRAARPGFDSTASTPALGLTEPPIQWVRGGGGGGRVADGCNPPNSIIKCRGKEWWSYTSTPPYVFIAWCLIKHRVYFTFSFYYDNFLCPPNDQEVNKTHYQ
jgi:hypothetical protein